MGEHFIPICIALFCSFKLEAGQQYLSTRANSVATHTVTNILRVFQRSTAATLTHNLLAL
jgi:hypothetical protein